MAQDETIHHSLICKHFTPATDIYSILSPSTFLNCRHIVILFWCAEAPGQHIASVSQCGVCSEEGGSRSRILHRACDDGVPRRLSCSTSWIMSDRPWYFHMEHKWHFQAPALVCLLAEEEVFQLPSSAYVNIFSAPFTLSAEVVVKSALCHAHLKYFMYFRSWVLSPHEGTPEFSLATHEGTIMLH